MTAELVNLHVKNEELEAELMSLRDQKVNFQVVLSLVTFLIATKFFLTYLEFIDFRILNNGIMRFFKCMERKLKKLRN